MGLSLSKTIALDSLYYGFIRNTHSLRLLDLRNFDYNSGQKPEWLHNPHDNEGVTAYRMPQHRHKPCQKPEGKPPEKGVPGPSICLPGYYEQGTDHPHEHGQAYRPGFDQKSGKFGIQKAICSNPISQQSLVYSISC